MTVWMRAPQQAKTTIVDRDEDDDGLPNTYDYTDSFIDDNTQRNQDSGSESESDYEDSEDLRSLKKDAKKFIKNKKLYQK